MKSILFPLMTIFILLSACKKPDNSTIPTEPGGDITDTLIATLAKEGTTQGSLTVENRTIEINGKYKIANDRIEIISILGNLKGAIVAGEGNTYNITFDQFSGSFEGITDLAGTISSNNKNKNGTHNTTATNTDIPEIAFKGALKTGSIELYSYQYLAGLNLKKSVVYFTHSKFGRRAEIRVKNSDFNSYDYLYHLYGNDPWQDVSEEVDFCTNEIYGNWGTWQVNSDNMKSGVMEYNDGKTIDGYFFDEYNPYIPIFRYVLDKEKEYEYEVLWDNGIRETGKFNTDIGGSVIAVCVGKNVGGYQQAQALFQSKIYHTTYCYEYPDRSAYAPSALAMGFAEDFNMHIFDMPEETTGLFPLADSNIPSSEGIEAHITVPNGTPNGQNHFASGGYIKKTGRWSFEYSIEYKQGGSTHAITGKGDYIFTP